MVGYGGGKAGAPAGDSLAPVEPQSVTGKLPNCEHWVQGHRNWDAGTRDTERGVSFGVFSAACECFQCPNTRPAVLQHENQHLSWVSVF